MSSSLMREVEHVLPFNMSNQFYLKYGDIWNGRNGRKRKTMLHSRLPVGVLLGNAGH